MTNPDSPSFESSLETLQHTVEELESGDLGLDASLAAYDKGVRLLAQCHELLNAAERQVALLTGVEPDGSPQTKPFDAATAVAERESSSSGESASPRKRRPKVVPLDDESIPF